MIVCWCGSGESVSSKSGRTGGEPTWGNDTKHSEVKVQGGMRYGVTQRYEAI